MKKFLLVSLVMKPQNFEKAQKKAILEAIELADWAKAFALTDKLLEMRGEKPPIYAQLRKKFIAGKTDEDFVDQVKVLVKTL